MVVAEVVMAVLRRAIRVMVHEGPRGHLRPTVVVVVVELGLAVKVATAFLLETPLPRGTMASNCLGTVARIRLNCAAMLPRMWLNRVASLCEHMLAYANLSWPMLA